MSIIHYQSGDSLSLYMIIRMHIMSTIEPKISIHLEHFVQSLWNTCFLVCVCESTTNHTSPNYTPHQSDFFLTQIFERCVVRCAFKNMYPKKMSMKRLDYMLRSY